VFSFVHDSWPLLFSSISDNAKNVFHSNPENTVFDAKCLIGRKFNEPEVQRDMKHWPFAVANKASKPAIQVAYKGELCTFLFEYCAILTQEI